MNESLCAVHGALHRPTSDGHDPCHEFWQARFDEEMSFRQALDVPLACHRLAPFCFNNGNTFAAIARTMILQLDLSSSAAVVRSAAGHYVAGVLPEDELDADPRRGRDRRLSLEGQVEIGNSISGIAFQWLARGLGAAQRMRHSGPPSAW